jgi:hypothetical protein
MCEKEIRPCQRTNSEKVAIPRKKFDCKNFFLEEIGKLRQYAVDQNLR